MTPIDSRAHWDAIYRAKPPQEQTWYQAEPHTSLAFIRRVAPDAAARIIDVGGGASTLVDALLAGGYRRLTVLDLATSALEASRRRLGAEAAGVAWIEADVLTAGLPRAGFDVWHDRAVFHFLTTAHDRARYVEQLRHALAPGGHALIATFAEDGPTRCSGLPVVRYAPEAVARELGHGFTLVDSVHESHVTPAGTTQAFMIALLRFDGRPERSRS